MIYSSVKNITVKGKKHRRVQDEFHIENLSVTYSLFKLKFLCYGLSCSQKAENLPTLLKCYGFVKQK